MGGEKRPAAFPVFFLGDSPRKKKKCGLGEKRGPKRAKKRPSKGKDVEIKIFFFSKQNLFFFLLGGGGAGGFGGSFGEGGGGGRGGGGVAFRVFFTLIQNPENKN